MSAFTILFADAKYTDYQTEPVMCGLLVHRVTNNTGVSLRELQHAMCLCLSGIHYVCYNIS